MSLTQSQLNAAFARMVTGDLRDWESIRAAIHNGDINVTATLSSLTLTVRPTLAIRRFIDHLERLRATAGVTQEQIAQAVDVSDATISRMLHGITISSWPTTVAIVIYLGGDLTEARTLFVEARDELRRNLRRD